MDDFNKDKAVWRDDAMALAAVLEALAENRAASSFIGGLGVYGSTASDGRFVHVDTRPAGQVVAEYSLLAPGRP